MLGITICVITALFGALQPEAEYDQRLAEPADGPAPNAGAALRERRYHASALHLRGYGLAPLRKHLILDIWIHSHLDFLLVRDYKPASQHNV
jgi:hypothetical protein